MIAVSVGRIAEKFHGEHQRRRSDRQRIRKLDRIWLWNGSRRRRGQAKNIPACPGVFRGSDPCNLIGPDLRIIHGEYRRGVARGKGAARPAALSVVQINDGTQYHYQTGEGNPLVASRHSQDRKYVFRCKVSFKPLPEVFASGASESSSST